HAGMCRRCFSPGVARQRDVAIRSALGASRIRIASQFLVESLLIAFAATVVGVGLMWLGFRLLAPWVPTGVPFIHRAGVNRLVLAFAAIITVASACLTGLVPACMSSASTSTLNVREKSGGRGHRRAITLLVASQVALTIVLLVSTGLLMKSAAH